MDLRFAVYFEMRPRSDSFTVVASLLSMFILEAHSVWTDLGEILSASGNAPQYKDGHKSDCTSRRTICLSASWLRRRIRLHVQRRVSDELCVRMSLRVCSIKLGRCFCTSRTANLRLTASESSSPFYTTRIKQQMRNPSGRINASLV